MHSTRFLGARSPRPLGPAIAALALLLGASCSSENEPVKLDRYSPVLHLIQTVRDEAHRFAVTFHRTRRNAARLASELEQVEGVGQKTLEKLLREFGSVERVRGASQEDLTKTVGPIAARRIRNRQIPSHRGRRLR